MQITILRHGKPDFEWSRMVKGSELKSLVSEYDLADIADTPPQESINLAGKHKCIVCSDLPRSIQSAKALGAKTIHRSSSVFREMNLPYFNSGSFKMPLKYWAILLRSLWFVGFSKNTESISFARSRAQKVSEQLIGLAEEHYSVLFVGHGFLNHFVVKELLTRNWVGPKCPGKKYWEFGTYEYLNT